MKAVAYVASTLPIGLLNQCLDDWGVNRIVLHGRTHLESYRYLQKRHPNVELWILPDSLLLKTVYTFWLLLQVRLTGQSIYFFHECCCPFFDLLVNLIRPNGHHYPQVTLQSFVPIPESQVPATRMHRTLRMLQLHRLFDYYRGEADNDSGCFFVQSFKKYPASIQRHSIAESRRLLSSSSHAENNGTSNRVLLLCGRDVLPDQVVTALYRSVVDLAIKYGYECDIKDHPAMMARLNFRDDRTSTIDPSMPLELIPNQYGLVIGMGSTGLLHFSKNGVSLLLVQSNAGDCSIARRVAHLRALPEGLSIKFPDSLEELDSIFAQKRELFVS